jgi:hypothetical protein
VTYADVMLTVAEDSDEWTDEQWGDLEQLVDDKAGERADRAGEAPP